MRMSERLYTYNTFYAVNGVINHKTQEMDKNTKRKRGKNSTNLAFFLLFLVHKLNINNRKYQNSDHISAVYLFMKYSICAAKFYFIFVEFLFFVCLPYMPAFLYK